MWVNELKLKLGVPLLEEDIDGYLWYQSGPREYEDIVGCVYATGSEFE